MKRPPKTPEEIQLVSQIAGDKHSIDLAARVVYPWGKPNSTLKKFDGPMDWQSGLMREISEDIYNHRNDDNFVLRYAIGSGHGIGKSSTMAMVSQGLLLMCPNIRGVITANTEVQLRTKTFAEMAKWYHLHRLKHWLNYTATKISMCGAEEMWRIDAIPWSERNSEAFAGLHGDWVFVGMDESSAIHDSIYETTEGAMLTGKCIWASFGNVTRPTGRFRKALQNDSGWKAKSIDARDVPVTNKEEIEKWIQDHGIDSDFIRVRVRGLPPKQAANQLISTEVIENSMKKERFINKESPVIIGVDPARFGDDLTVITVRQGLCLLEEQEVVSKSDSNFVADVIEDKVRYWEADKLFIDSTAEGVIDVLRGRGIAVTPAVFSRLSAKKTCYNKRVEMYVAINKWLLNGGVLFEDKHLKEELEAQVYEWRDRSGNKSLSEEMILLPKKIIKIDLGRSPDRSDSLACTFYEEINYKITRKATDHQHQVQVEQDYNEMNV